MYYFPRDFGPLHWALQRNQKLVQGINEFSLARVVGEEELDSDEGAAPSVSHPTAGRPTPAYRQGCRGNSGTPEVRAGFTAASAASSSESELYVPAGIGPVVNGGSPSSPSENTGVGAFPEGVVAPAPFREGVK